MCPFDIVLSVFLRHALLIIPLISSKPFLLRYLCFVKFCLIYFLIVHSKSYYFTSVLNNVCVVQFSVSCADKSIQYLIYSPDNTIEKSLKIPTERKSKKD